MSLTTASKTEKDAKQATTSFCDRGYGHHNSPLQSQGFHRETTTRNSAKNPSRKRRLRAFAVLTTITTTLWWCQTIALLQFLPPSVVEASSGRIPPPPPPPRPPPQGGQKLSDSEQKSSDSAINAVGETSVGSRSLEQQTPSKEIPPPPPPPPPKVVSKILKEEGAEASVIESQNTAKITKLDIRHVPPPPPPPKARISTEAKENTTSDSKESSSSTLHPSSEDEGQSTPVGERKQNLLHREEQAGGLYRYVRQNQVEHHNIPQLNYYPQQHQYQHQYQHQQPTRRLHAYQGHASPKRAEQSSSHSGSALASTLKGLWGKVERGLDDLAGLEGSVAGQAQKLVNSAISTASTASRLSPSSLQSIAQSGATATVARVRPHRNQRKAPPTSNVPLKPYGQKYEIARETKEKEEREKNDTFRPIPNANSNKQIHAMFRSGDKNKSIATKGGATSSPYGYPQNSQESPSSSGGSGDDNSGTVDASREQTDDNYQPKLNANSEAKTSYGANWNSPKHPGESEREDMGPASPSDDSYGGMKPSYPESQTFYRGPPMNGKPNHDPRDSGLMNRGGPDPSRPQPQREPQQDKRDSHSRNSRIPWDTNKSSPNSKAPGFSHHQKSLVDNRPEFRYEDSDTPSWKRVLKVFSLPPLPKLKIPSFRRGRRSNAYYSNLDVWDSADGKEGDKKGGFFGWFKRSSSTTSSFSQTSNISSRNQKQDANDGQPSLVASMLSRCNNGKSVSLLLSEDAKASKAIGRYKAILDVLFLVSILLGFKLLSGFDDLIALPSSWQDMLATAMPKAGSALNELLEGSWALFAFLYAALFKYYRDSVLDHKIDSLSSTVSSSVKEESEYSQLYLRLMAATPMDRHLPDRLASIAKTQVASIVAKARLNSFVGIVLASLTVMTVSAVGPFVMAICSAITKIVFLEEWRQWPVAWEGLLGATSAVMRSLFHALESQGASALRSFLDSPIQFSFHLSMFFSLLITTLIPSFEERRAVTAKVEDPEEDDAVVSNFDSAEEWSRLGTSSASRLSMLSENGSVESALARWRASHAPSFDESLPFGSGLSNLLRLVGYGLTAALLAGSPLVVSYLVAGETPSLSNALSIFRWDSLFDLSFLQFFLFGLLFQTLKKVIESGSDVSVVREFQSGLISTKEEVEESNKSDGAFQVMGSVSPSAGISVRDLWAAHAAKRAWAIRGANLQCKNGEILAVLGEDGNGKTRLLTTLAESLTFPPKRSTTTNKVRGLIAIGGLDVAKWDRKMLKRRLGILLSDVRMVADSASLFSGWTMEEILEPVDGLRSNNDPLHRTYTKAEKSAMILALKVSHKVVTFLLALYTFARMACHD